MCATVWRHLVNATIVNAGLPESNGSLPPVGWLKVTCGLTACTPESAPGPTLGNEYGITLPFTLFFNGPLNRIAGPIFTKFAGVGVDLTFVLGADLKVNARKLAYPTFIPPADILRR